MCYKSDTKTREKEPEWGFFFRDLTQDLTQLLVQKGSYRVLDETADICEEA